MIAHQNETLIVLAERIVPNSTQAQVNRFVDTMISVDTQENQKKFLAALGEFDHEAISRYNHPFKALSEEQQNTMLTEASTAKASQPGQGVRQKAPAHSRKPARAPPVLTLRDHFDIIKGWVSGAFYSSEFGMKELGWTGQVAWDSLPGCRIPTAMGSRASIRLRALTSLSVPATPKNSVVNMPRRPISVEREPRGSQAAFVDLRKCQPPANFRLRFSEPSGSFAAERASFS